MKKKRILAMLLCVCMLMSMMPLSVFAASDKSTLTKNVSTGVVYFGKKADGTAPALYRIVAKDTDTMTLFYDGANIASGLMKYDSSTHDNWSGSDICLWLNGNRFLDNLSVFSSVEKNAIIQYNSTGTTETGGHQTITVDQKIVLPSVAEVTGSGTWGMDSSSLSSSDDYWLRSPGSSDGSAAFATVSGNVYSDGSSVSSDYGVRPAFKLNLSSVLFTSAASGGKSGTAGATLAETAAPSNEQKLTIIDSTMASGAITAEGANSNANTTVKVNVTGATASKSVSAIITDSAGAVTYYGKIGNTDESGNASSLDLILPVTLDTNNVLKIFVEEINGDNLTDYASELVAVTVTAPLAPTSGSVTMPWGESFMVNNKTADDTTAENRTTVIKYNEKDWYVIGANGTGIASTSGTMTLFAKNNIGSNTQFHGSSNVYGTSALKTAVDKIYTGFTAGEKSAVSTRTLEVDTYKSSAPWCDGVATTQVDDAALWPLSAAEAKSVNNDLRIANNSWWLRSPGALSYYVAVGYGNVTVDPNGNYVRGYGGVRPAFKLNLSSVIFASSAEPFTEDGSVFSENAETTKYLRFKDSGNILSTASVSTTAGNSTIIYSAPASSYLVTEVTENGKTYVNRKKIATQATGASLDLATLTGIAASTAVTGKVWIEKEPDTDSNIAVATAQQDVSYTTTDLEPSDAPIITTQPTNKTVTAGQTATFSVTATGTEQLSYRWQVSTDSGSTWNNVTGGTGGQTNSYTTVETTSTMAGYQYQCVVTNAVGTVITNAVTLSVALSNSTISITDGGTFTQNSAPSNMTVTINDGKVTAANNFKTLTVDGNVVDPSNYTVVDGSIKITFTKSFLNTLSVGTHPVVVALKGIGYENIVAKTEIVVSSSGGSTGGGGSSYDYYTITVTQSAGGTISPSTTRVRKRTDKTYTITPSAGYVISNVLIDGKSVGTVSSYTFKNVTARHTISAVFKETTHKNPNTGSWENPFVDVKKKDWFYEKVAMIHTRGLMNGTSTTTFEPNSNTTRGMIVTVLYNMEGKPDVASTDTTWYANGRAWAMSNAISDGMNMDAVITREQLVTMLWRQAGSPMIADYEGLTYFTDAKGISDYAKQAMMWAHQKGIIKGKGNGILDPRGNATRAEVATMMINYLNATEK